MPVPVKRLLSYLLSMYLPRRSRMSLAVLKVLEDVGNDSGRVVVVLMITQCSCMYDDDMFIWYDSDLCMRALCMVFIPPSPASSCIPQSRHPEAGRTTWET